MKYIKNFKDISISDIPEVGGKNASLGQMIGQLAGTGVRVPGGFAITAQAYRYFLEYNDLMGKMAQIMGELKDYKDTKILKKVGSEIRALIVGGTMPDDLKSEIAQAYKALSVQYGQYEKAGDVNSDGTDVAVRSSATAEDLPTASFAGQQETFLNVSGVNNLMQACKRSMASLFTDRAIVYRIEKGFDHFEVALSVGVQKMVRSDAGSAGVIFTLDTQTGFKDIIMINSSWGLGEIVVKGEVIPDEFLVFKPTLEKNFAAIIKKSLGDKNRKIIYKKDESALSSGVSDNSDFTKTVETVETAKTSKQEQNNFSLSDDEILELAKYSLIIEKHYSKIHDKWMPMDIEWAKDGQDGKLYILQARPETVHAPEYTKKKKELLKLYKLKDSSQKKLREKLLLTGQSIGSKIASGKVRVIESVKDIGQVQEGDILVAKMTDPDWVPAMKKAAGIITDRGGRTCHAAIVSRELAIPAIVGAKVFGKTGEKSATEVLKTGQEITLDCSQGKTGFVYEGALAFVLVDIPVGKLDDAHVNAPCQVMVNIANPDSAFNVSFLPNDGVGLARIEFIVSGVIQIHPMALIKPEEIRDYQISEKIAHITRAYPDKKQFFVDNLAYGISTIASAFYPKPVIVRLSDFKTNEYRNLIGGTYFEPEEENPMLGWRGASRYYNENYKSAFALECQAIKKARDEIGLRNIKIMVPFVRTVQEAEKVLQELAHNGLEKNVNSLEIIMMCEIPSNVILIDQFSKLFDGFSIGSNDLTQLILGVDRDSEILSGLFDERDQAVKKMMALAIEGAQSNHKPIGICGQAPSDLPEIAKFLIDCGIESISLNPDALADFLMRYEKG
ncbi:phosphoenolpyruvate synthase [Candidatus Dependentiae bacterium]